MIKHVTTPQCFSAFYSKKRPCCHHPHPHKEPPAKVKVGSLVGAATGALGAAFLLAKHQSKLLKKPVNILNMKYSELGIQAVATSSLVGGLAAGVALDEPKYRKAKFREGVHQAIANIMFPILLIGTANKLYEKVKPKVKLPQLPNTTKLNKVVNATIQVLPNLAITAAGLVGGVCLGTKVSNKINECAEHHCHERKVKPLDFIYHPDDVATALVLADKNGVVQKVVGKVIPPIFTLCGYETGIKR